MMNFSKVCLTPIIIFIFTFSLCADTRFPTIAVLDFQNNSLTNKEELNPLCYGLADMMISAISVSSQLKVVERKQLKSLLEEQALGLSGVIDDSSTQTVGKLLGAEYLVLGSFIGGFKGDIRIDCRIVKTETGENVKAEEVSGDIDELLELLDKLSRKTLKNLQIRLSKQENKKIEDVFDLCDQTVLTEYFKALSFLEYNKYEPAVETLDKIVEKCPHFSRAIKLRNETKKRFKK